MLNISIKPNDIQILGIPSYLCKEFKAEKWDQMQQFSVLSIAVENEQEIRDCVNLIRRAKTVHLEVAGSVR